MKKRNRFEVGKAYQHHSGHQLYICGMADTISHGVCFIAESGWNKLLLEERIRRAKEDGEKLPVGGFNTREFIPVGMNESHFDNYSEIDKEVFYANNFSND